MDLKTLFKKSLKVTPIAETLIELKLVCHREDLMYDSIGKQLLAMMEQENEAYLRGYSDGSSGRPCSVLTPTPTEPLSTEESIEEKPENSGESNPNPGGLDGLNQSNCSG
jgi:hypothetical protein